MVKKNHRGIYYFPSKSSKKIPPAAGKIPKFPIHSSEIQKISCEGSSEIFKKTIHVAKGGGGKICMFQEAP